jgi:pilus assembly protein CpaB
MNRKMVGLILAFALATFGTFALAAYVRGAEDRALAGQELVEVIIVDDDIAAGSTAEDVARSVITDEIPDTAVPDDFVVDLSEIEGLVAAVDLVPGEILIPGRFESPTAFDRDQTRVIDVPPGLQEVTVTLDPNRAVGGNLVPGDTVGVFLSFEPFELTGTIDIDNGAALTFDEIYFGTTDDPVLVRDTDGDGVLDAAAEDTADSERQLSTPNTTHLTLHKVLVTNIQLEQLPETIDEDDDRVTSSTTLAPTGNLLVTLALDGPDAERLIFGTEFGFVYLSAEPDEAAEGGTRIQTRGSVYLDEFGAL